MLFSRRVLHKAAYKISVRLDDALYVESLRALDLSLLCSIRVRFHGLFGLMRLSQGGRPDLFMLDFDWRRMSRLEFSIWQVGVGHTGLSHLRILVGLVPGATSLLVAGAVVLLPLYLDFKVLCNLHEIALVVGVLHTFGTVLGS